MLERAIHARNFFLCCESPAAEKSEWVQRERAVVELAQREQPKRVGRIRADVPEIDKRALDEFVATTRVFPSCSYKDRERVVPFFDILGSVGVTVFSDLSLHPATNWKKVLRDELEAAAKEGWIIAFISKISVASALSKRNSHTQ